MNGGFYVRKFTSSYRKCCSLSSTGLWFIVCRHDESITGSSQNETCRWLSYLRSTRYTTILSDDLNLTSLFHIDLYSVLTVDPHNQDVKAIIHLQHLHPEMVGITMCASLTQVFTAIIASQRARGATTFLHRSMERDCALSAQAGLKVTPFSPSPTWSNRQSASFPRDRPALNSIVRTQRHGCVCP